MRRNSRACAAALAGLLVVVGAGCQTRQKLGWSHFDIVPAGAPQGSVAPGSFEACSGTWVARERADAPSPPQVLQQDRVGENADFNLALLVGHNRDAGKVSVQLRAIDGEHDQGGGVVWRAQGMNDYYLARWNPLEKNVRAYVVRNGERKMLKSEGVDFGDAWHRLEVEFNDDRFKVTLVSGEFHISGNVDTVLTMDGPGASVSIGVECVAELPAGRVGVWTKADARTMFDDFMLAD
ncbi:MAG: hypothetical protein EXS13_05295 [Planctomycetes bacterium]|nr:hypothetical protein [Planctomycetota bacterium]